MIAQNSAIEHFIESYLQRQDYYRRVAELCYEHCREALSQNGIRHIATYRAKGLDRLKEKLYHRAAAGSAYANDEDIEKDIVDLAGARVALYFPGELPDAVRVLSSQFQVLQTRTFPGTTPRRGTDVYAYRFPGYSATHLLVKLKHERLERPEQKYYSNARVEVQIASVFMHAWAEVEHDLVYKPLKGESSIGEYSLLDQVNGLAFTGDVALEQLQRIMKDRIARAERRFQSHYDLASHIHNAYASRVRASEPQMGRVDKLLVFLRRIKLDAPDLLQPFIEALPEALDHKPLVDRLRDQIIQSDPQTAEDRRRVWAEVDKMTAVTDVYADNSEDSQAATERRLKKRWATFEMAARQVLAARHPKMGSLSLQGSIDRDTLQALGFDSKDVDALVAAQQAYIRVLTDQWQGKDNELQSYAETLQSYIQRLYAQFPDLMEGERGGH